MTEQEIELEITEIIKGILLEKRFPFGVPQRGIGNKRATGNLINSIKVKNVILSENYDNLQFDVDGLYYLLYVDKGRDPLKVPPPIQPILNWIRRKGINIRDEKGRFTKGTIINSNKKQLGLAFAISKSIGKRGIRATNVMTLTREALVKDERFKNFVIEEIKIDVTEDLQNKIKEITKIK